MRPGNFQIYAIKLFIAISFFCGYCFTKAFAGLTDTLDAKKPASNYPSFYQGHIKVDGKLADWPSKMFYDNIDARLVYAVGNDSSCLYFCLQILDQSEQMSVLHEGLTFMIEPGGKKKEAGLVQFPYGPAKPVESHGSGAGDRPGQPAVYNPSPQPGDRPEHGQYQHQHQGTYQIKQKPRSFSAGVKLSGFREGIDGIYPADTVVKRVETAMAYDTTGALVLEIAVPFSCFKNDLKKAKYVSLGFVVTASGGGSQQEEGPPKTNSQGGGMHGGGGHGGMHGGGMGGGQGGMGGGQEGMAGGHGEGHGGGSSQNASAQNQSKNYKTWHKFSVAPGP
jgi:hypothetical protein